MVHTLPSDRATTRLPNGDIIQDVIPGMGEHGLKVRVCLESGIVTIEGGFDLDVIKAAVLEMENSGDAVTSEVRAEAVPAASAATAMPKLAKKVAKKASPTKQPPIRDNAAEAAPDASGPVASNRKRAPSKRDAVERGADTSVRPAKQSRAPAPPPPPPRGARSSEPRGADASDEAAAAGKVEVVVTAPKGKLGVVFSDGDARQPGPVVSEVRDGSALGGPNGVRKGDVVRALGSMHRWPAAKPPSAERLSEILKMGADQPRKLIVWRD